MLLKVKFGSEMMWVHVKNKISKTGILKNDSVTSSSLVYNTPVKINGNDNKGYIGTKITIKK